MKQITNMFLFMKKYKFYIFIPTITLLLFLSCFVFEPLWIFAIIVSFVFYIFCDFGEQIASAMFFGMFSIIGIFYVYSIICAFVVATIRYVFDLIKKRRPFIKLPFFVTVFILVVFSLIHYKIDNQGFEQGVMLVGLLLCVYLAFVYKDEITVKKCFDFLFYSLITTAVLGVISIFIPNFSTPIFFFDGTYNKLRLFNFEENSLSVMCIFGTVAYLSFILNKNGKFLFNLIKLLSFVILGSLTLSKSFFLLMATLLLSLMIYTAIKYRKKSIKFILPALAVVAILVLVFHSFFEKILSRFLIYGDVNAWSLFDRIFTGRTLVWQFYINKSVSSINKFLWGHGLFNEQGIYLNTHSVYIDILYRTGLVGFILFFVLIYSYIKEKKSRFNFSYPNILLLLSFIIISFEEMIFSDRFAFILFLSIIMLTNKKEEAK